jgi:ribosomal protein S18 acetylase RimI-like enzyme
MRVLIRPKHALLRWFFRTFYRLSIVEFSAEHQQLVQGFVCGQEEWELPLAAWITGPEVLEDMDAPRETKVWLYTRRGKVVGYGSVGKTWRPFPIGGKSYNWVALIPMVAIQTPYQGKPGLAAKAEKYSGQILYDLIEQSREYGLDMLLLYVDPRNIKAKALYRKWDFELLGTNRHGYEIMGIALA